MGGEKFNQAHANLCSLSIKSCVELIFVKNLVLCQEFSSENVYLVDFWMGPVSYAKIELNFGVSIKFIIRILV